MLDKKALIILMLVFFLQQKISVTVSYKYFLTQ